MRKWAVVAVLGLAFAVTGASANPDDHITYRKQIMQIKGAAATAMGLIAEGKVPHDKHFLTQATTLVETLALAPAAFRENTDGQGREKTTAKANIWTDWADFEKRFQELEDKANDILTLASTGGVAVAAGELPGLFRTCKGCHDDYRTK